jgi:hypothetical protein
MAWDIKFLECADVAGADYLVEVVTSRELVDIVAPHRLLLPLSAQ